MSDRPTPREWASWMQFYDMPQQAADELVEKIRRERKDAFKAGKEAAAKVCDNMMHAVRLTKEACAKYILELADEA